MSAPKVHEVPPQPTPEPEVTAQPKPVSEDFLEDPDEAGASLEPDELGAWALRGAVQQGYVPPSGTSTLSLMNGPASDDALSSPNFEEGQDVWEQTIDLSLQSGGIDATREAALVASDEDEPETDQLTRDIDLNQDTVREASLFDAGSEETADDSRDPDINADNDSPEHIVEGDEAAPSSTKSAQEEVSTQSFGGRARAKRPAAGSRPSTGGRAATKRPRAASASKTRTK